MFREKWKSIVICRSSGIIIWCRMNVNRALDEKIRPRRQGLRIIIIIIIINETMGSGNESYLHLCGGFHSRYTHFLQTTEWVEKISSNKLYTNCFIYAVYTYMNSKHKRRNHVNYWRSIIYVMLYNNDCVCASRWTTIIIIALESSKQFFLSTEFNASWR